MHLSLRTLGFGVKPPGPLLPGHPCSLLLPPRLPPRFQVRFRPPWEADLLVLILTQGWAWHCIFVREKANVSLFFVDNILMQDLPAALGFLRESAGSRITEAWARLPFPTVPTDAPPDLPPPWAAVAIWLKVSLSTAPASDEVPPWKKHCSPLCQTPLLLVQGLEGVTLWALTLDPDPKESFPLGLLYSTFFYRRERRDNPQWVAIVRVINTPNTWVGGTGKLRAL